MPRQTMQAAISRRVARMPERCGTGMMGLGWPIDTSQTTCSPCISTLCGCNEVELAAFKVSWQVLWFAAILA